LLCGHLGKTGALLLWAFPSVLNEFRDAGQRGQGRSIALPFQKRAWREKVLFHNSTGKFMVYQDRLETFFWICAHRYFRMFSVIFVIIFEVNIVDELTQG